MKQLNYETGKRGEEIARRYLRKKGYKILESNFNTRFGEIDVICTHSTSSGQARLVFVEVKLKIGEDFGTPEEMISKRKIAQVQKTGQAYLIKNPKIADKFPSLQIDAIAIVLNTDSTVDRISHYKNVGFEI